MNTFIDCLKNIIYTDNGMKAHKSTGFYNGDFFGLIDRFSDESKVEELMEKSLEEDPKLAIANALFLRDIKKGKGVRDNYKIAINKVLEKYPEILEDIVKLSLETDFGRADDFHYMLDGDNKKLYANILKNSLFENKGIFKWLPTKASNKLRTKRANILSKQWKMTNKEYHKFVVEGRKELHLVETKLVKGKYSLIEYDKLPSLAALKYTKAFYRNDLERYDKYISDLANNNTGINTSTLTPVDIVRKYITTSVNDTENELYNQAWNALSENPGGKKTLVVADVSGSMCSPKFNPLTVSIASAIYASQFLSGDFKDIFVTFSEVPTVVSLSDVSDLKDKIIKTRNADWGMNTDIEAVLKLISQIYDRMEKIEYLDRLLIISDMEFDECIKTNSIEEILKKYFTNKGHKIPEIVFWNVNAKLIHFSKNDEDIVCISGYGKGIFDIVLNNEIMEQSQFTISTLNDYVEKHKHKERIVKIFEKID